MGKKSLHRSISLALVVAMCITLLAGTGLTVSAEGTETPQVVGSVALTIDESLLLTGSVYDSEIYANIVSSCFVTDIKWMDGSGDNLENGAILSYGNSYRVGFTMTPEAGFAGFAENVTVTLGNYEADIIGWSYDSSDPPVLTEIQCEVEVYPVAIGEISEISLPGIEQPVAGTSIYSYTDPDGKYTATGTWSYWDETQNAYIPSETTFDGTDYCLEFQVTPNPGYTMADEVSLYINNEPFSSNNYWYSNEGIVGSYYFNSPSGTVINEVKIDEALLPVAKVGDTYLETEKISVPVSSEQYQIFAYWRDEDESSTTGTFSNAPYLLQLEIYAKEGYYFADEVFFSTNSFSDWPTTNGKILYYMIDVSLETPIEEVVLTKVPVAELGNNLSAGEFTLEVPAGAKYTATASWGCYDAENGSSSLDADTTVESGMKYFLGYTLIAESGYRFADEFDLVINGITRKVPGGSSSFYEELTYSFLTQIPSVEVTGVTEPVIGAVPSYDSLTVAEPEKYEIAEMVWNDFTTGDPVIEFEDGHAYYLQIMLKAKAGYEFAPYTPYKIAGFGDISYTGEASDTIDISSDFYSLETVISDIQISNVPTVVIGETANIDISFPSDAMYEAIASWYVWNEQDGVCEIFTGVFEKGKTYHLVLEAYPKTGYRFDNDTTVWYQDGTQIASASFNDEYYAFNQIDYPQEGATLIRMVELSIEEQKTGQHASVPPTVKLLNVAGCHVAQPNNYGFYPPTWLMGDNWFEGYFVDGTNYGVAFNLIADEGYVFAEDLIIVINGTLIPADAITRSSKAAEIEYYFNMTCEHIYDNDSDSTCNICGYERFTVIPNTEGNPNTGDSLPLGMYFVVMMASAAAMIELMVSNKKNKIKNS